MSRVESTLGGKAFGWFDDAVGAVGAKRLKQQHRDASRELRALQRQLRDGIGVAAEKREKIAMAERYLRDLEQQVHELK